jgi:hypothetical protein
VVAALRFLKIEVTPSRPMDMEEEVDSKRKSSTDGQLDEKLPPGVLIGNQLFFSDLHMKFAIFKLFSFDLYIKFAFKKNCSQMKLIGRDVDGNIARSVNSF